MKRSTSVVAFLLIFVMLVSMLTACTPDPNSENQQTTPETTTPETTTPETTTPEVTTPEATTPDKGNEGGDPEPDPEPLPDPEPYPYPVPEIEPLPDDPVALQSGCKHLFARRKVLTQVTTTTDGTIVNVCEKCGGWKEETLKAVKSLKILAVGNSFSDDAMEYLAIIAKAAGVQEIVLGNLYIGGCSIKTHYDKINSNSASYTYRKNTGNGWVSTPNTAFETALIDEKWTIITVQQVSQDSGIGTSFEGSTPNFPYLSSLLVAIQGMIKYKYSSYYKTAPIVYWHMTWAYSLTSTHSGFKNYNNDQLTMYNAIVDTVRETVSPFFSNTDPLKKIVGFIPSGTAIQNVRTSYFRDADVTRDGYHLSYTTGRFVAGLTWFRTLTGLSIDEIAFDEIEGLEFLKGDLPMIKEAVNNAYLNPLTPTQSEFLTR